MTEVSHTLAGVHIEEWRPDRPETMVEHDLDALAEILHAVVHAGAGVSFVVPFSLDDARGFWVDRVLPSMRAQTRRVVVLDFGAVPAS